MFRKVPEARIKRLQMHRIHHEYWDRTDTAIREEIILEMGVEIARKLFEFNKVLITFNERTTTYDAALEIIVPIGAPDA